MEQEIITETKRLITLFRKMADASDADILPRHSDYYKGMSHGLAIGYRSAANMLESSLKQYDNKDKTNA